MATPAQAEPEQPSPTGTEWALIAAVLALLVIGAGAVALARQVAKLLKITPRAAAMAVGVIGYKPGQYKQAYIPTPGPQTTRGRVNAGTGTGPASGRGGGAVGPGGPAAPPTPTAQPHQPGTPAGRTMPPRPGTRTAAGITQTAEQYYRAAFLAKSGRRIQDAIDNGRDPKQAVDREKALWQAHFAAYQRRSLVAKQVDVAVAEHGNLLGWKATLDSRTSKECKAANGCNFRADQPPAISFPGAVHPRCRCKPVAPYPGARMVDDATQGMGGSGFERRAAP